MITQAGIVAEYRRRNFFESGGQPRKKSVSSEANPMVNAARRWFREYRYPRSAI